MSGLVILMNKMNMLKTRLIERIKRLAIVHSDVQLSSGMSSSYYIDYKMVSCDAEGIYLTAKLVFDHIKQLDIDCVAGVHLGGNSLVSALALNSYLEDYPLMVCIVNTASKETYGYLGHRVVIIDDVVTTGASLLGAAATVESYGREVVQLLAMVNRGKDMIKLGGYDFSSIITSTELFEH